MGCGCNGSSGISIQSNNVNVYRTNTSSKCPELREVIRDLDLRVINLLNVENKPILQETNKQLRMWMRNLGSYCPTEEELEIIRDFINKEEMNK